MKLHKYILNLGNIILMTPKIKRQIKIKNKYKKFTLKKTWFIVLKSLHYANQTDEYSIIVDYEVYFMFIMFIFFLNLTFLN